MAEWTYLYETFEGSSDDWDSKFTEYLNWKHSSGCKFKDCSYNWQGDKRYAYCVFKRG